MERETSAPRPLAASRRAFTFIEILITLSLMGVLFIPMMRFFTQSVEATRASRDMITAVNLARWELERLKNLSADIETLRALSNTSWPPAEEPPLEMNNRRWRIDRLFDPLQEMLEVRVAVRLDGQTQPMVQLVTLLSETSWVQ